MAQSFNTNLSNVAVKYAHLLKIPVTTSSLKQCLEQHPFYPSLYSISNSFDKFGITNQAFTITEEDFTKFEPPYITYYNTPATGKDFIVVTASNNNEVSFISIGKKVNKVSKTDFFKNWQKTVLIAEAHAASGEVDFQQKFKQEKHASITKNLLYTGSALILMLLFFLFIHQAGSSFFYGAVSIGLINLLGLATTILLLVYDIDKSNSFVKNICTAGKQTNCDAVLNSKAGKILGISWSEAGFFYFATSTIFLFTSVDFTIKIAAIAFVSSAAAAYIPFSIYYQWKIVKQWCPLCLSVQAILALELFWCIVNFWTSSNELLTIQHIAQSIGLSAIAYLLLSVLLPIVAWYLVKPSLLKAKDEILYRNSYKRLLYNPGVFESQLLQQEAVLDGWQQLGITIGNPNATNTIIKVCNPYCGPCAKAHKVLHDILSKNANLQIRIIYFVSDKVDNEINKPVLHFLQMMEEKAELLPEVLDYWYTFQQRSLKGLQEKFPLKANPESQLLKIAQMEDWCIKADIPYTPKFFINGRTLPEKYDLSDLEFIV